MNLTDTVSLFRNIFFDFWEKYLYLAFKGFLKQKIVWFYQRQISHSHLPRSDRSRQAKFTLNLRRPFPNYDSLYNKLLIWVFSFSAQDVWKLIGFCVDMEPAVCFGTSIIFDLHLIREKMRRRQISPVFLILFRDKDFHPLSSFVHAGKNKGSPQRSLENDVCGTV